MNKPVLYLLLGYPGSGKTVTSRVIAELTGAEHIWADHERQKKFQKPTHSHPENLELYADLNQRADDLLADGKNVIFDTNFNFYKDRQKLRQIAAKHGAIAQLVWVVTAKDIARHRATQDSHGKETRVWGNMPEDRFERITSNLQEPREDESYIQVDGTKVAPDYIKELLIEHGLL